MDKTKYSIQTKHISLQCNFVKCYVEEQLINIKYVQTDEQRADILTKSLHVPKIKHLIDLISLVNVWRGLLTCITINDTTNVNRTDSRTVRHVQIHNPRHVWDKKHNTLWCIVMYGTTKTFEQTNTIKAYYLLTKYITLSGSTPSLLV